MELFTHFLTQVEASSLILMRWDVVLALLVGSVGVVGVQGCTSSKDPRTLAPAAKTNG